MFDGINEMGRQPTDDLGVVSDRLIWAKGAVKREIDSQFAAASAHCSTAME
jgi:hypothetical protein